MWRCQGQGGPSKLQLPGLKLTPDEREEMLQDKAWPLCGSDLFLLFTWFLVLSPPAPWPHCHIREWGVVLAPVVISAFVNR